MGRRSGTTITMLGLVGLALGCGGDDGAGPTDAPRVDAATADAALDGSGDVVLFVDEFTTYPNASWVPKAPRPDAVAAPASGNPAPSIVLGTGPPYPAIQYAGAPFAVTTALRVGLEVSFDSSQIVGNGVLARVRIIDQNNTGTYAQVEISMSNNPSLAGRAFYGFFVNGASLATTPGVPFAVDDGFHAYKVAITGAGAATWTRDDIERLTAAGFPTAGPFVIEIETVSGTPGFRVDNVRVTR